MVPTALNLAPTPLLALAPTPLPPLAPTPLPHLAPREDSSKSLDKK